MSVNIKTQDGWKRVAGKGTPGSDTQISKLSELQDVSVDDITNGQILAYNTNTEKWENLSPIIQISADDVIYNRYFLSQFLDNLSTENILYNNAPLTNQLVYSEVLNVPFSNGSGTINIDPHSYVILNARLEDETDFSAFFITVSNNMANNNHALDICYMQNHQKWIGDRTFSIRLTLLKI